MPKLATIKPYEFEGHLLIALDAKWKDYLDGEEFTVSIKNSRLVITGPKILKK